MPSLGEARAKVLTANCHQKLIHALEVENKLLGGMAIMMRVYNICTKIKL